MTAVALRPAAAADLAAIARIWREGWADGHVPEALVAERTPASFDERAAERISRTWVAERGGVVAGFVVVADASALRFSAAGTRSVGRAPRPRVGSALPLFVCCGLMHVPFAEHRTSRTGDLDDGPDERNH